MARQSSSRPKADAGATDGGAIKIVVRRGARKRFQALEKKTADLPVVLSWDRRESERRTTTREAPERRKGERRQEEPFSWTAADFVVVVPKPHDQ